MGDITEVCNKADKKVDFGNVETREYPMTLGVNPATKIGSPVCLDWDYQQLPKKTVDERSRKRNRKPREFYLNYYRRVSILEKAGFSEDEINRAEKNVRWARNKRKLSEYQSFPVLWVKKWKVQFARWRSKSFVKKYRKQNGLKGVKKRKIQAPQ